MGKWCLLIFYVLMPLLVIGYAGFLIKNSQPVDGEFIVYTGLLGDSFGILTCLFSALAFIGVLLTYFSQKEESQLQKQEIRESRKEIKKQGFESTFFQLLKLHNDIVDSLVIKYTPQNIFTGRSVLRIFKERVESFFKQNDLPSFDPEEKIEKSIESFYKEQGEQFTYYLRFLYNIFKFLDESDIEGKSLYAGLIRAQLSDLELYIIYYNSLTPRGEEFKDYIKKFQLMDNLQIEKLYKPEHAQLIQGVVFKD